MAEEEGGRGIIEVWMSIVGSGRGSLYGGSGIVTLLGGSIESWSGGGRILIGGRLKVLGGSGEFDVYGGGKIHSDGGSKGRKHGH